MTRIVVIGAGIVGCALADELTLRGHTDVTVIEQGPLFTTGGSSSHAPGLVFQTNPSRTMSAFARYTVEKYVELGCFDQVGSLEVATTPERVAELYRRHGFATAWGIPAEVLDAEACRELYPLLGDSVLGGLHVPSDGLARAVPAGAAQARRAESRGARFIPHERVVEILRDGDRVAGVRTDVAEHVADIVVSCAGFWGPAIGALAGVTIPLLPMAHQYVRTSPVASPPATILRHQDRDLYFRAYDDHLGVGSYLHDPMPVDPAGLRHSTLDFTPADFEQSWAAAVELLPSLQSHRDGFNGVFSFTPDGFPLLGESPTVRGFWSAEAVWVTHSAGVARAVAEWIVDGRPSLDLHECDLNRFHESQLAPPYVRERAIRSFVEVYDIIHPLDPPSVRDLRVSPFHERQVALGAVFGEGAGWERPLWYESNPASACPPRDAWSARHWSPIAATEARRTRENVALYDMTPLMRLEVVGPVSFLQGLTTNNVDRPVGTVVYTLLLDSAGGIRSDVTVARLAEDRFQVGVNGPLDLHWLRRHAPAGVTVRDITGGTCCIGVWGPRARDLVAPLTDVDVSHAAFGYFKARQGHVGTVPVTMLRVSYVGELGWEIYASADQGLKLWDTLWAAGRELGAIAAGRAAFNSLRLEKGYRLWGTDMSAEDDPYAAGLGFAVRPDAGDFLGRSALPTDPPARRLTCLVLTSPDQVPMGREPVFLTDAGDLSTADTRPAEFRPTADAPPADGSPATDARPTDARPTADGPPAADAGAAGGSTTAEGRAAGYVTSAAFGHTIGAPIAYAWLPPLAVGTPVQIGYFGKLLPAVVSAEPLVDPGMERIRR